MSLTWNITTALSSWMASAMTQWRPWSPETRKTIPSPIAEESHFRDAVEDEGRWGGRRKVPTAMLKIKRPR